MKHTTLVQAHRIHSLSKKGLSTRKIGDELGISHMTVARILNGEFMVQARAMADRMEVFLGGAVIGNGNVRFHASSPGATNDDGHYPTKQHHPINAPYENGRLVPLDADVLSQVLAEEDLIDRITEAGIDPEELLLIDYDADTEVGMVTGGEREHRPDVHKETWEEFEARATAEAHGNVKAHMAKLLENEGAEVDVWSVRKNPDDTGLWGSPWVHPNERG